MARQRQAIVNGLRESVVDFEKEVRQWGFAAFPPSWTCGNLELLVTRVFPRASHHPPCIGRQDVSIKRNRPFSGSHVGLTDLLRQVLISISETKRIRSNKWSS